MLLFNKFSSLFWCLINSCHSTFPICFLCSCFFGRAVIPTKDQNHTLSFCLTVHIIKHTISKDTCVRTHIYACIHTCTRTPIVCIQGCVTFLCSIYINLHVHMHMYAYIYTDIHTYIHHPHHHCWLPTVTMVMITTMTTVSFIQFELT